MGGKRVSKWKDLELESNLSAWVYATDALANCTTAQALLFVWVIDTVYPVCLSAALDLNNTKWSEEDF